jgi:hypothetical protein
MTPVECIARLCALVPPPRYPFVDDRQDPEESAHGGLRQEVASRERGRRRSTPSSRRTSPSRNGGPSSLARPASSRSSTASRRTATSSRSTETPGDSATSPKSAPPGPQPPCALGESRSGGVRADRREHGVVAARAATAPCADSSGSCRSSTPLDAFPRRPRSAGEAPASHRAEAARERAARMRLGVVSAP